MLDQLRQIYDYVIVDTPPVGSVIDGAIIAESCDGLIIVIEANAVSYRFVQRVKEQLNKTSCPILGVILNKVDSSAEGYGRYGRYGQYGRYGRYGQYGEHADKK
jgi:capsular exopolysaccharide synthesis family protein